MPQSVRLNDFGGFPYLRTHPLTVERIGEARARASGREDSLRSGNAAAAAPVSPLEHTVAQARARVLMDPRVDALRRWQARDADRDGSAADKLRASCESALASSMLRDWARADAGFATARALARSSPNSGPRVERAVALMQVQSLLDRGATAQAAEAMKAYANDGSRPSLLLDAQITLLAMPAVAPDSAALKANASALQTWVALHPGDALAWTALGQTWGRLGQPLRSIRAEAEARYSLGDLLGAADRLRAGQRLARGGGPVDFIDASVLDSRLRAIEAERKQIAADKHAAR